MPFKRGVVLLEQRLDRLEGRVDNLEKEMKAQEIEFAETRVYVREGYKKMNDIAIALEAMKAKSNTRLERFFEKLLWVVLGIAGTYIATQLNLK
jgi:serine/threonine protein kinase HipA of HipAB toxin-antitoxin module